MVLDTRAQDPQQPVAVIGAASAGLFAAAQLARDGVRVEVFERSETLEPKARTLIVTPELERVLGFDVGDAVVNRVHTLELCTPSRTVAIKLREPDLIVERAKLLRMLARRAEQSGVSIRTGHSFHGLETGGGRTYVSLRQRGSDRTQRVAVRAIIAADGARSLVARSLGYAPQPTVTVIQARVALPRPANAGVGKVWFLPSDTPYFYWLCPESTEAAAVGLVDVNPRLARAKLDRFIRGHSMEPLEYQGALVPLFQPRMSPWRRLGRSDILLLGDAAGQVKVTTVGGTVTGLYAAQAAARTVTLGTSYVRELRHVNRELHLHWWLRALMLRLREREYDALLQMLNGKAARLLEIHNRDRLVGGMWPIIAAQPRLSLLAAQLLWRARAEA